MADNDEPLDDLRAVTMQAGAAAARVIETIARDQQNRTQQQHHTDDDQRRRQAATQTATVAISRTQLDSLPYDSPERRAATNEAMRAAAVPDEARHAAATADLLNGVDPAGAAGAGARTKVHTKPATKAVERGRGR